jgi:hypothetical protein
MDHHLFQRLCIPHVSTLVVAAAWLLNHLQCRVRTGAGQLTKDRRALVLTCKGIRSERIRQFVLPFYVGQNAIAHRLYFMSVLEKTGIKLQYQLNGRASRGTRELAYFGPTDRCMLLWSSDMVHKHLAASNFGWSGAKINEMASYYPGTPILLLDDMQHALPTADQCLQIYHALEHHNGTLQPRKAATRQDGIEQTGLQVICSDNSLGRMQLILNKPQGSIPDGPILTETLIAAASKAAELN